MDDNNLIPSDVAKTIYLDHLAVVLSNLGVFSAIFFLLVTILPTVVTVSYMIFIVFYTIIIMGIIMVTLGLILASEDFRDSVSSIYDTQSVTEKVKSFYENHIVFINSFGAVSLILLILSTTLLVLNRNYNHTSRIITNSIMMALVIISFILGMVVV
ncbi:MAG: hypothetical protein K6G48_06465 [Acholeplasmatales bacterium]|nr:hypothetical protein [Acholeplasmatales bacterium]